MSAASSRKTLTSLVVRPLTAADAPAFEALCARDPLRYLTPRMNLETYGYASPNVRVWGAFEGEGGMHGILLRFSNTMVAVDSDGACGAAFAAQMDAETGLAGIRGTAETVSAIQAVLQRYTPTQSEESRYLRLDGPPNCPMERLALARPARQDDLDKLAALYAAAGTMYRSRANVTAKLAQGRVFVVEESAAGRRPARIVSCALLNVEGRDAGLIGGVYTLPEARGKGYAAACTAALALDLESDGKTPFLFYENPIAGRVYRRLGFEEVGHWIVLYLAPNRRFPRA